MKLSPEQPNSTPVSQARIWPELKRHAPYTLLGTITGMGIAMGLLALKLPRDWSVSMFWTLHPLHVVLSAMATVSLYRHWTHASWVKSLIVGYIGAVGIATLSDCIIPFIGEWMMDLPNRGIHLGFIEKWWLVNPLAVLGVILARPFSKSTVSHAGHVLVSTWASLFHIQMSLGNSISWPTMIMMPVFLFLAVWIPCCSSDIAFPVVFSRMSRSIGHRTMSHPSRSEPME